MKIALLLNLKCHKELLKTARHVFIRNIIQMCRFVFWSRLCFSVERSYFFR